MARRPLAAAIGALVLGAAAIVYQTGVRTPSPKGGETAVRNDPAAATVKPGSGASFRDCPDICPEMVLVPKGEFLMGSPEPEPERENWKSGSESPQIRVKIPAAFAMGKYAVTFAEFDACVADGGCPGKPGDQGWGRGRQPVINVDWSEAKAYVAWLSRKTGRGYRLPSETEREYAARAGATTPFWWGDSITTEQANYDGTALPYGAKGARGVNRQRTQPVDNYAANPWGLMQIIGNVWEWTEDCWNDGHASNPADGSARLVGECNRRVMRGGSWFDAPRDLRAAFRSGFTVGTKNDTVGFRVARDVGR